MNREEIQAIGIKEISETFFSSNNIYMGEFPTGSGKTYIALQSAVNILKKTNKSVIISAANSNNLAFNFIAENKKHNIIENSMVVPLIGVKHYIDRESIIDDVFLKDAKLDIEEVKNWLAKAGVEHHLLVSEFMEYFKISPDYSALIANMDMQSAGEDFSMLQRLEKVTKEPKIYITNHSFLLVLYKYCSTYLKKVNYNENLEIDEEKLNTIDEVRAIPLIIDEVHTLNDAASLLYSDKFSLRLTELLLTKISNSNVIKKSTKNFLYKTYYIFSDFEKTFSVYKEGFNDDIFIERLIKIAKTKMSSPKTKKEVFQIGYTVKIIDEVIQDKKVSSSIRKSCILLKNELKELMVLSSIKNFSNIKIILSPSKKYLSFISLNKNPIQELRNNFFLVNNGFVAGLTGTLKVSQKNDLYENRWSLERIGIYKAKEPDNKNNDAYTLTEQQLRWNNRISSHVHFTIKPRIFKKSQAQYHIFKDKRYLPPKGINEESELKWIKNIAEASTLSLNGNTLILMSSFDNCELLARELITNESVSEQYDVIFSKKGESLNDTKRKYEDVVDNGRKKGILIGNLAFFTGVDMPHHYVNTLIIGKLPFEPMNIFSKMRYGSSSAKLNMFKKAVLTFRQGLGRGLRSSTDEVFISICDPRILNESANFKNFLYFLDEMAEKVSFK